jgi:protein-L-isoaspartate(D-aspartate) O-methyltransferase
MNLIDGLIEDGWLETKRIIEAFRAIARADFMPDDIKYLAEQDLAFPIGYGQTISQPLTVAFMLEKLQPNARDKVLDIGSGSGWTTALLAHIVGERGKVIAIEIIPELKELGERNAAKYNFVKKGIAKFVCADGSKGFEEQAPYDRILVSASVEGAVIPQEWKDQLKVGGRIVAPIESSIWVFEKTSKTEFEKQEYPDFVFVPLV